jgi:hypothetical protein
MQADDVTMAERKVHAIGNPIAHLLLQGGSFATVTSRPIEHEVLFTQEKIVGWHGDAVTTAPAVCTAIARRDVRTAGIKRLGIIDHALVSQNERHVQGSVIEFAAAIPGVECRLGHPHAIDRDAVAGACARHRIRQIHLEDFAGFELPCFIELGQRGEAFVVTRRIKM